MENKTINLPEMMAAGVDFLNIVITRNEVMTGNISAPMEILSQLLVDTKVAFYFMERVDIFFDGYNEHRDELWEIPEVRNYVYKLDATFPYWFFFLSKHGSGLYVIVKCYLLPFLVPEAEDQYNKPKLQNYLLNSGFPAMNQICDYVGLSEFEIENMSNRTLKYFYK